MRTPSMDLASFAAKADDVAHVLKTIGNSRRLMILCKLVEHGERTVGDLVSDVGLSQSAVSQHLAKMRDEGLIEFRRQSQSLWYRLADPRLEALLSTLNQLYCKE